MIAQRKNILRLDWVIILVYFLLLGFGIGNILSSSISGDEINIFDLKNIAVNDGHNHPLDKK